MLVVIEMALPQTTSAVSPCNFRLNSLRSYQKQKPPTPTRQTARLGAVADCSTQVPSTEGVASIQL